MIRPEPEVKPKVVSANTLLLQPPSDAQKLHSSTPIKIEFVNSAFLVYDKQGKFHIEKLKKDYRIVAEAFGTKPSGPCDVVNCGEPFVLLEEQAFILEEFAFCFNSEFLFFGYARIVRLKKTIPDASKVDTKSLCSDDGVCGTSKQEPFQLAVKIAKGRKAKALKRKANENPTAAKLRVRSSDLEDIEVTAEEVNVVVSEMKNAADTTSKTLEIYNPADDAYEEVLRDSIQTSPGFRIKFSVFRDLWRRGYYMTSGLKFGCDYLLYEKIPGEDHAKFLVKCVSSLCSLCPLDIAALSRVGSQVKKEIILAIVSPDSFIPYYIQMSWWKS